MRTVWTVNGKHFAVDYTGVKNHTGNDMRRLSKVRGRALVMRKSNSSRTQGEVAKK